MGYQDLRWKDRRPEGHLEGFSAEVHAVLWEMIFLFPKIEHDVQLVEDLCRPATSGVKKYGSILQHRHAATTQIVLAGKTIADDAGRGMRRVAVRCTLLDLEPYIAPVGYRTGNTHT